MKNKEYFIKIHDDYLRASEYSSELYRNIGIRLNDILTGEVVDFGNGGIINYDTTNIDNLICVDLIFNEASTNKSKIEFIHGNFYEIDLSDNFDCILTQFLLHHLGDDKRLMDSIRRVNRKLRDNGNFIIVEIALPSWLELIQNATMNAFASFLKRIKKPGVRFFSEKSLIKLLTECGFRHFKITQIPIGKKTSPAPVMFPKLRIPGKFYPFKCILIEAKKSN